MIERKTWQRTVTSIRAHWGTRIPEGTGFGNLRANYNVNRDRFSATVSQGTHDPGGKVLVQLVTHSDQLLKET